MGKGIAKAFRERYPAMFKEYRALCDRGELTIRELHLWKGDGRWILNFPTKTTWRLPSKVDYIEQGLKKFVENYEKNGCGFGFFSTIGVREWKSRVGRS
jgi:hypothetical protein